MNQQKKTQKISKLQTQKQPSLDFPQKKKINTLQHYTRYCKSKQPMHTSMLIKPIPLQNVGKQLIQQVDDFVLKLLFCGIAVYAQTGLSAKYLDKVEQLASQNFLAYIITDQSLCYGANFPISNVILRDTLASKLNMNEMFQLIGRAGRVGQSWTARAFLQKNGLEKLNDYIHKPECQLSNEGQVFEKIADQHLNYPLLRLRTLQSQIRYLDNIQNNQNIQILIKKKNIQDSHLFRKVCLIPYVKTQNRTKILCHKMPFSSTNKYIFPSSNISYDDIPKILNKNEQQIINIAGYYQNQQQFISKILENTISRIINEKLNDLIKIDGVNVKQLNHFKPKVYQQYFNKDTNTFAIMIQCSKQVQFKQFKFHQIIPSQPIQSDDLIKQKLKSLISQSIKLTPTILQHPSNLTQNQAKKPFTLHKQLLNIDKLKFYKDYFSYYYQQQKQHYSQIISSIIDKDTLDCKQESIVLLTIGRMKDVENYNHGLFHIDEEVRTVWDNVNKKFTQ